MSDSSGTQEAHRNEKPVGGADDENMGEYERLIQFIRAQKGAHSAEEEGDGSKIVKKRNKWTPWKTREVRVNKEGEEEAVAAKVPSSW